MFQYDSIITIWEILMSAKLQLNEASPTSEKYELSCSEEKIAIAQQILTLDSDCTGYAQFPQRIHLLTEFLHRPVHSGSSFLLIYCICYISHTCSQLPLGGEDKQTKGN